MGTPFPAYATSAQAAEACGRYILDLLDAAWHKDHQATLAISGGSSPRPMFEGFAKSGFAWERVQLFWVDERAVPATDSQSNFKLAADTWLTPAHFPAANVHRIAAELTPESAARQYAEDLRKSFQLTDGTVPRFDVIHRGMGPDGHTASLFPGEPEIDDRKELVAAVWVEKFHQWRITLLPAVLQAANHTAMLVTGADKAAMLRAALYDRYEPKRVPVQLGTREGGPHANNAAWFLDEAAAVLLEKE